MFTGMVEQVGKVLALEEAQGGRNLQISMSLPSLKLGESISVNGVCLTLTEFDSSSAQFFLGLETLRCTHLGRLKIGDFVNLERSLLLSDSRIGGHFVQGHVDGLAELSEMSEVGSTRYLKFKLPVNLNKYCVSKGAIALNGVSLTLCEVGSEISVQIIPFTWTHTSLRSLAVGDLVNVEVDLISKYVEKLCRPYQMP